MPGVRVTVPSARGSSKIGSRKSDPSWSPGSGRGAPGLAPGSTAAESDRSGGVDGTGTAVSRLLSSAGGRETPGGSPIHAQALGQAESAAASATPETQPFRSSHG